MLTFRVEEEIYFVSRLRFTQSPSARVASCAFDKACLAPPSQLPPVLDSGITSLADLEMAVQTALVMRPPFQFMNEIGPVRALELVQVCKKIHPDFPVPESLVRQAKSGEPWVCMEAIRKALDEHFLAGPAVLS